MNPNGYTTDAQGCIVSNDVRYVCGTCAGRGKVLDCHHNDFVGHTAYAELGNMVNCPACAATGYIAVAECRPREKKQSGPRQLSEMEQMRAKFAPVRADQHWVNIGGRSVRVTEREYKRAANR